MSARRNGAGVTRASTRQTPTPSPSKTMPPRSTTNTTASALVSTRLENILLLIYPAILVLGSLYSLLDPASRSAPYSVELQSHPPAHAPSYFALKSNVLNRYFVKVNWVWVSAAYTMVLLHRILAHQPTSPLRPPRQPSPAPPPQALLSHFLLQSILRYTCVTIWWIFTTQWFFGPALIDRGFRMTGGACDLADSALQRQPHASAAGGDFGVYITGKTCKLAGGQWRGGHDISGHVFILVLGSGFLVREMLPTLLRVYRPGESGMGEEGIQLGGDDDDDDDDDDGDEVLLADGTSVPKMGSQGLAARVLLWIPLLVIALSLWMLLMTAIYFHTWFEKLTGLLVAFAALGSTFGLSRVLPTARSVLGTPS